MPRQETVTLTYYRFEELSDSAKERARDWWKSGHGFSWNDESLDSIKTFCARFGIRLLDWRVGPYYPISYRLSEYDNSNFRGVKLKTLTREDYPTGYCLDATLSIEFYDTFKATGDAKHAFQQAVEQGFIDWRNDLESQLEDDYVDDVLAANEYEFTEDGAPA
jgi:hypothetical protein